MADLHCQPPALFAELPDGLTGALHGALGMLSASVSSFDDRTRDEASAAEQRIRGKIVLSRRFRFANKVLEFQERELMGSS